MLAVKNKSVSVTKLIYFCLHLLELIVDNVVIINIHPFIILNFFNFHFCSADSFMFFFKEHIQDIFIAFDKQQPNVHNNVRNWASTYVASIHLWRF